MTREIQTKIEWNIDYQLKDGERKLSSYDDFPIVVILLIIQFVKASRSKSER